MIGRCLISGWFVIAATLTGFTGSATAQTQIAPPAAFATEGIDALKAQLAAGDTGAALILGRVLADKTRSEADHLAAVGYLQQASDAGLIEASLRLGDIYRNGLPGVAPEPGRAVDLYALAAAAGDNAARRNLATMLIGGQGVERDVPRAVALLEAAVAAGNIDARVTLAGLYAKGDGVAADPQRAVALYSGALADNNRGALSGLGALYRRGAPGLAAAPELARGYYQAAADLGDPAAIRTVADMTIRGEGGTSDPDAAIAMLETLAATDPATYATIGDYYQQGQVVPMDAAKAAEFYQRAADNGVTAGWSRLGEIYRAGAGAIDVDAARAYGYFVEASKAGDLGAARKVADMTAKGEGTPADLAAATASLESLGDAASLVALGDLYSRGDAARPDIERAIGYFQAAADTGLPSALTKIGDIYRLGLGGTPPSGTKAATYYRQAAELNDNAARRALANMLIDGRLLRKQSTEAATLLTAALDAGDAQAGIDLGNAYASGALGSPDLDKAIAAFDAAAAKGNETAPLRKWVAILNGPLAARGGKLAVAGLQEAAAAKTPGAALELARLVASGKVTGVRPAEAIAILQASEEPAAIRYLIQLYRDGSGTLIKPDRKAGEALLEASAGKLGPDITRYERVLLNASLADASRYDAIGTDLKSLTRSSGMSAVRRLRSLNQNAYVYVVQQWLQETGQYTGSINGTLSKPTITAFNAACQAAGQQAQCVKGPLSTDAATAFATIMYRPAAAEAAE